MGEPFWTEHDGSWHEAFLDEERNLRLVVQGEEDDRRGVQLEYQGQELWGQDYDAKYSIAFLKSAALTGAELWLRRNLAAVLALRGASKPEGGGEESR